MRRSVLFGEFLITRGLATEEQILRALDSQKKSRPYLGTMAIMEKYLTMKDVYTILNRQVHEPEKKFGQIAIELGLLDEKKLDRILNLQKERTPPHVGELLVEQGVLTKDQLYK